MDAQVVEHLLKHQPFYTLRLSLTNRTQVEIHRPELAKVTGDTLKLFERDPADPTKLRVTSMIALYHVVTVEQIMPDEPTMVMNP
jgi:hypothetical protein